ncbi:MAG: DNA-3-methyladenine glycosylase I [Tetragenococcus halophilus]|uniref:3-methyladenine-DNA glycosylase I n=2 Tax=Tetragenococcus halophilus TaxID=51669 RepID=A0A2H6DCR5_TETHA|nr:DNA-3-methyladenine glycosylase I [Tetragenococcus halophilus]AOF48870.1 DNA-3-methyladenine glycosylase [Tetragenococcus halophilus]AYW50476.1 DNA-3-methyladenine glycosylase I [Tetragenococcus halophilus]MCF1684859.1 DNA-3-methyladenine glycosylase I [Tetragenococcus halophilus]MCO7026528.1 DNA-3-methyladenine glycosylase I [Tetragenococcus halophilus]MCO8284223.1 DNA-3-methyladenine glycosylase I [Tetragenococcus halophilus]
MTVRCDWAKTSPLMQDYHDYEWGKTTQDDRKLYELLLLESMQAGLSWSTILDKRENFRSAFDQFDYTKVANYNDNKIAELLTNPKIIRNHLKINAAVNNAQMILNMQEKYGSFSTYIWSFVENPIINHWQSMEEIPASSNLSKHISKELKKVGFKFVGPTIIYSFMQAIGMVDDHIETCSFKYENK